MKVPIFGNDRLDPLFLQGLGFASGGFRIVKKVRYTKPEFVKASGLSRRMLTDLMAGRRKTIDTKQLARFEKALKKNFGPSELKAARQSRHALNVATPYQLREIIPQMTQTKKGRAYYKRTVAHFIETGKGSGASFGSASEHGSPKAKRLRKRAA